MRAHALVAHMPVTDCKGWAEREEGRQECEKERAPPGFPPPSSAACTNAATLFPTDTRSDLWMNCDESCFVGFPPLPPSSAGSRSSASIRIPTRSPTRPSAADTKGAAMPATERAKSGL